MIRLLFWLGDRLTEKPTGRLLLHARMGEVRNEVSLGHLLLVDGVPDTFVVSRVLVASQNVVVARLTLRALVVLVVRNWLLSGFYAFVGVAYRAGFLDVSPWDIPGPSHWRWAFWKPRVEADPPPAMPLPPWLLAGINRVRALARTFGA